VSARQTFVGSVWLELNWNLEGRGWGGKKGNEIREREREREREVGVSESLGKVRIELLA